MTFGKLTVIGRDGPVAICKCDCGRDHRALWNNVRRGLTRTCGKAGCKTAKHRMGDSPEYKAWWAMISRCTDENNIMWRRYGGRGIKVCQRWMNLDNFLADMGKRPDGMSLDRINNDGNYEPNNCRWATKKQQTRNRSSNHRLSIRGESKTISEWAEDKRCQVSLSCLKQRVRQGFDAEVAVMLPVGFRSLALVR